MVQTETLLIGIIIILAIAVFIFAIRELQQDADIDDHLLRSSIGDAISDLDLDHKAGVIETHAQEIKQLHSDIETILRSPQERGSFGEHQLEVILSDQLPSDMYGTQERIVDGKQPDAYIKTPEGNICIDSKFSLQKYERYLEAEPDSREAEKFKREFAQAVEKQLEKIRSDYIRPDQNTTEFAFMFIPSERVYYHLVHEEYDLLRKYSKQGVLAVSPLTFGNKLELIKTGVHAKQLSEKATEVQAQLDRLRSRFDAFEDVWGTFQHHMGRAEDRAEDADNRFNDLKSEFDRIDQLSMNNGAED